MTNEAQLNVKIDENISVIIKMPTELDVITLNGILQKVEKITRISNLPSSLQSIPHTQGIAQMQGTRKPRSNIDFINDEAKAKEVFEYWAKSKRQEREELANAYGLTYDVLEKKLAYARSKFKLQSVSEIKQGAGTRETRKGVKHHNWTAEEDAILVKMRDEGKSFADILDFLSKEKGYQSTDSAIRMRYERATGKRI